MSDTRMLGPRRPRLTYSLRGSLGLELEVRGPWAQLYSGNFGGAVHNPAQALCEIIADLHDHEGRIAVPDLYSRVRVPTVARDNGDAQNRDPRTSAIARDAGVERSWGEPGFTACERTTIRPALVVNGIHSGYPARGGKAIVPAAATAKLQLRLVPEQDPAQIERLVRARIRTLVPATVRWSLRGSQGVAPAVVSRRHPAMAAAVRAYERGFGATPVLVTEGTSNASAVRLASRLGDTVRGRWPIRAISQDEGGVAVAGDAGQIRARESLSPLRRRSREKSSTTRRSGLDASQRIGS